MRSIGKAFENPSRTPKGFRSSQGLPGVSRGEGGEILMGLFWKAQKPFQGPLKAQGIDKRFRLFNKIMKEFEFFHLLAKTKKIVFLKPMHFSLRCPKLFGIFVLEAEEKIVEKVILKHLRAL